MKGAIFERHLSKQINQYFQRKNILALCYRVKQCKYAGQPVDLMIDSPENQYYAAIECKTVKAQSTFYFSTHMKNQLANWSNIKDFLNKTGRKYYLIIKHKKHFYVYPKDYVQNYQKGKGLKLTEQQAYSLDHLEWNSCFLD